MTSVLGDFFGTAEFIQTTAIVMTSFPNAANGLSPPLTHIYRPANKDSLHIAVTAQ